jgi:hypothetical protein
MGYLGTLIKRTSLIGEKQRRVRRRADGSKIILLGSADQVDQLMAVFHF